MNADETAVNRLILLAITCKRRNSPEWMNLFAACINDALRAYGSDDRVKYPGAWSNEFHLEIGGDDLKVVDQ
jgi:hypothetical protein